MLTPYLEQLIQDGKAEYREYAIGGSGVGTIPVQTNQEVIITDFVWNPFTDAVNLDTTAQVNYAPIVLINVVFVSGPTNVISVGDSLTIKNAGLAVIATAIVLDKLSATRFHAAILTGDISTMTNLIDLTTGGLFNTGAITFTAFTPPEGLLDTNTLTTGSITADAPSGAAGKSPGVLTISNNTGAINNGDHITGTTSGANAITTSALFNEVVNVNKTITSFMQKAIHHLRFRSKGMESTFNFRDTVKPILGADGSLLGIHLGDPIQVHTYLWFRDTVQIDIFKFSPSGNVFVQGNPLPVANEPNVPNGYRAAIANPPVLRITTGQAAIIVPLGNARDIIAPGTARWKNEFIDDIGNLTELDLPPNNLAFPLVNISYVLITNPITLGG